MRYAIGRRDNAFCHWKFCALSGHNAFCHCKCADYVGLNALCHSTTPPFDDVAPNFKRHHVYDMLDSHKHEKSENWKNWT